VVVGFLGNELRHPGGRAHALDPRDASGAFLRPVHAAGIELDDAFGVGQTAPADAGLIRIELDDADAGDEGIEHVGVLGHHLESPHDAGDAVLVLGAIAVRGGDDARFDALGHDGRRLPEQCLGHPSSGGHCGSRRLHELAAVHFFHRPSHLAIWLTRFTRERAHWRR
jgi:hypothetical protein